MNIAAVITTFNPNEIYRITYTFFSEKVEAWDFPDSLTKPNLFDFYEVNISESIDSLKDSCDEQRIDFLEAISVMSWALYRVWTKLAIDEALGVTSLNQIDEQSVITLFLENLDCDEGRSLLEKVKKSA